MRVWLKNPVGELFERQSDIAADHFTTPKLYLGQKESCRTCGKIYIFWNDPRNTDGRARFFVEDGWQALVA